LVQAFKIDRKGGGDTRTQKQDGGSIRLLWKSMIEILFSFPTQFFPRILQSFYLPFNHSAIIPSFPSSFSSQAGIEGRSNNLKGILEFEKLSYVTMYFLSVKKPFYFRNGNERKYETT
jgi:hypothetical protein